MSRVLTEKFDFICVTETHVSSRVDDNEIKISGCTHVRCKSTSPHTGGVVFYVSELWEVNTLEEIAVNFGLWWLKIKVTLCA